MDNQPTFKHHFEHASDLDIRLSDAISRRDSIRYVDLVQERIALGDGDLTDPEYLASQGIEDPYLFIQGLADAERRKSSLEKFIDPLPDTTTQHLEPVFIKDDPTDRGVTDLSQVETHQRNPRTERKRENPAIPFYQYCDQLGISPTGEMYSQLHKLREVLGKYEIKAPKGLSLSALEPRQVWALKRNAYFDSYRRATGQSHPLDRKHKKHLAIAV